MRVFAKTIPLFQIHRVHLLLISRKLSYRFTEIEGFLTHI